MFILREGPPPGGWSAHDQLSVTGTVNLASATLVGLSSVSLNIGDSYTIIANDGADAIVGTFAGLAQNSFFTNGSTVFQVSYTGGSGNDVVLTTHHYLTTGTTRTWSGLGADGLWTTPQNWVGNVASVPGDLLSFPNGAARPTNTNNYPTNTFFQKIQMADAYQLKGNPVALQDGLSASVTATVELPVISTGGDGNDVSLTRVNPPYQISGITPQANGAIQISGTGQPGLPHVLEGTTNLNPVIIWVPVRTNNADPLGLFNFLDPAATNFPMRFYRIRGP